MKVTDEKNPETILTELENFHPQFIQSSQRIMEAGNFKLFTLDFLALSVNNRAISLING